MGDDRARERHFASQLAKQLLAVETPSVTSLDPPEPDALIELGDNATTVGVEITWLDLGNSEELRRDGERQAICRGVERAFAKRTDAQVLVALRWAPYFNPQSADRALHVAEIVNAVQRHLPLEEVAVSEQWNGETDDVPDTLSGFTIMRTEGDPLRCESGGSAWAVPVTTDHLKAAICRKNAKPRQYRRQYEQVWLLLVMSAGGPATWAQMEHKSADKTFKASFHRIFVLDRWGGRVTELQVEYDSLAA